MDVADLLPAVEAFAPHLAEVKRGIPLEGNGWYPYSSLGNVFHLDRLLTDGHRDLLGYADGRPVLDIGAADGDMAFFLESQGCAVHVLENPPTNFNGCRGLHALRTALDSRVEVTELDLDSQFELPGGRFGLALFLGLLYHLKNPYYVLEQLARQVEHAVLSTRVVRFNVAAGAEGDPSGVNPRRVDLSGVPVAYLVDPHEANDDATNFWMFTESGLRRILDRTGWEVLDLVTVGDTSASDPASAEHDERAFCLLRSRALHD